MKEIDQSTQHQDNGKQGIPEITLVTGNIHSQPEGEIKMGQCMPRPGPCSPNLCLPNNAPCGPR